MLTIRNLTKSIGGRVLFEDANMTVNYGEKVVLVGPNGAGKTTLFSVILKTTDSDSGTVERDEWTMTGFLPQESEPVADETIIEVATGRAGELEKLEAELKALEDKGDVDVPAYFEAQAKFDALNNPELEAKAKSMLRGLGYGEADFERPAKEMSGGWIMRAHLARLLAMEPDLLMLDEPTNHLDLESLLWFQNYLKNFNGALFMISHDREFMDEIAQKTYDIHEAKLVEYKTNYSGFIKQRFENYERAFKAFNNQQKELKELRVFCNKFRNVSSKSAQVQSKEKMIEKMDLLPKPRAPKKPFRFNFPQPERGGQRAVLLDKINFAYGDLKIYNNLDLTIERGERTVLVGPNGAGKSTLLKILAGVLEPQSGERVVGHNPKIGYFSQHRGDTLDPDKTVIEEAMESAARAEMKEDEVRGVLGSFLFRKDDVFKKTGVLSGGEKSRLNLVKFLVDPPNLLLMDEPTTHLDIMSIEALILALDRYEGTLVFISHDVHFIRKIAQKVLHISGGEARPYYGDYDYFLEKSGAEDARAAVTA